VPIREQDESGDIADLHWPDAGSLHDAGALADGGLKAGTEREETNEHFRATLTYADGTAREYKPSSEAEATSLTVGSTVKTRVFAGEVQILGGAGSDAN
jgi:hypothetical protein